jgi:hypothetical protein
MNIPRPAHAGRAAWLVCWLLLAGAAAAQTSPESEEAYVRAPVTLDGRTLFELRGMSSVPASERAATVSARIEEAAADPGFDPQQIQVVDTPEMAQILAGQRLFLRVFDADAELERVDRKALALVQAQQIRQAIAEYR